MTAPGDVAEQLASRIEFVSNRALVEVASRLYVDSTTGKLKRGAGGTRARELAWICDAATGLARSDWRSVNHHVEEHETMEMGGLERFKRRLCLGREWHNPQVTAAASKWGPEQSWVRLPSCAMWRNSATVINDVSFKREARLFGFDPRVINRAA